MTGINRAQRRILHTSDLQVRSLDDEGCRDLEKIVELAIKAKLMALTGDPIIGVEGNVVYTANFTKRDIRDKKTYDMYFPPQQK